MARLTLAILTQAPQDSPNLAKARELCGELGIGFSVVSGSYEEILTKVQDWKVLPEILMIEVPQGVGAEDALRSFGDVAPEGESETLVFGVPNDISVYRHLKAMGVAEIFSDFPENDELSQALNVIAGREARVIGIDPRRVTYVWSASGGSGGTTFALAFANHFAKEGRRTLYVDMDVYAAPASFMFSAGINAPETSGFLDILSNPGRVDALFLERSIQKVNDNLFYLSSRRKSQKDSFKTEALSMIVARAQSSFDMVVVDTPWRAYPEPDWGRVNGPSYIVAAPTPQSLLGFALIGRELQLGISKSPAIGILNKMGELKSNDLTTKVFAESFSGKILQFPYDPLDVGRMFFDQKTIDTSKGKIKKPLSAILATLPARAQIQSVKSMSAAPVRTPSSQANSGFFSKLFGK